MSDWDLGGVLVASDMDALSAWCAQAFEEQAPEGHGDAIHQRVVAGLHQGVAVGFYLVQGYDTESENLAFSHAFFVMDGFLEVLDDTRPKGAFAFASVGDPPTSEDTVGSRSVAATLKRRAILPASLGTLRTRLTVSGLCVWRP